MLYVNPIPQRTRRVLITKDAQEARHGLQATHSCSVDAILHARNCDGRANEQTFPIRPQSGLVYRGHGVELKCDTTQKQLEKQRNIQSVNQEPHSRARLGLVLIFLTSVRSRRNNAGCGGRRSFLRIGECKPRKLALWGIDAPAKHNPVAMLVGEVFLVVL